MADAPQLGEKFARPRNAVGVESIGRRELWWWPGGLQRTVRWRAPAVVPARALHGYYLKLVSALIALGLVILAHLVAALLV